MMINSLTAYTANYILCCKVIAILFVVLLALSSCQSSSKKSDYAAPPTQNLTPLQKEQSLYQAQYRLVKADSLVYHYPDSVFIGLVDAIKLWNDRYIVSDMRRRVLWIFDNNFTLVGKIGGFGKGPGEFSSPISITPHKDSLYIIEAFMRQLTVFDKNFHYARTVVFPKNIKPEVYKEVLFMGAKIIMSGAFLDTTNQSRTLFANAKNVLIPSTFILSRSLSIEAGIFPFDEIYFNKEYKAYTERTQAVNLVPGEQGTFFAQQEGTPWIAHFTQDGTLLKYFGYPSQYWRNPPKTADFKLLSEQDWAEFYAHMSANYRCFYDERQQLFVTNFANFTQDAYLKSDYLLNKFYVQVYGNKYNCVLDCPISGAIKFIKNSIIYVLEEDHPHKLMLVGYKLEKAEQQQ